MKTSTIKTKSRDIPHLDESFSYAFTGMIRVENLIDVYRHSRTLLGKTKGRTLIHVADILRAAVVLCHANLEQLLRDVAILHANWPKELLQRIPLFSQDGTRVEKFTLADIRKHSEMSVNDLICRSVANYYEKRSFTSIDDVIEVLSFCSLDLTHFRPYFRPIKEMMNRRHHIAHTGDVESNKGKGKQIAKSINATQVHAWNKAVFDFVFRLSVELGTNHATSEYLGKDYLKDGKMRRT